MFLSSLSLVSSKGIATVSHFRLVVLVLSDILVILILDDHDSAKLEDKDDTEGTYY